MQPAQVGSHLGRQRILNGLGQIRHCDLGRVHLPACAASYYHRDLVALAEGNQRHLGLDRIDGIHHIVKLPSDMLGQVVGGDEVIHLDHLAVGVDGADALGHDFCLEAADRALHGVDLTIGVGDADVIHVDQGDLVDAGTGQRLGRPGANPAYSHHADLGLAEGAKCTLTIKTGNAPESL
ncbi:hypothetical protein D3C73_1199050 [compost metagenome]